MPVITHSFTHSLTYVLTYLLNHSVTYLFTPWKRVLLEKLTGSQKFPALHGTQKFITAFTSDYKRTLVQALRLCTGPTTHRGSRGIALLFLDHGTRRG